VGQGRRGASRSSRSSSDSPTIWTRCGRSRSWFSCPGVRSLQGANFRAQGTAAVARNHTDSGRTSSRSKPDLMTAAPPGQPLLEDARTASSRSGLSVLPDGRQLVRPPIVLALISPTRVRSQTRREPAVRQKVVRVAMERISRQLAVTRLSALRPPERARRQTRAGVPRQRFSSAQVSSAGAVQASPGSRPQTRHESRQ
jgi:hypothetical protein